MRISDWSSDVCSSDLNFRGIFMTIQVGDRVPNASFRVKTEEGIKEITTDELFKGKKVVLFSVPGALTPTCSAKHLPGFVQKAADFQAKGIDTIACMRSEEHTSEIQSLMRISYAV